MRYFVARSISSTCNLIADTSRVANRSLASAWKLFSTRNWEKEVVFFAVSLRPLQRWGTGHTPPPPSPDDVYNYSGFHFLCSFFRTVADSRSFVLKLCGLLEKLRHGLPSSPISKKIRKEDQFLRKFALIRSPICGGILGMQERHVCTIQRSLPSGLLNQGATTIASYS